MGVAFTFTSSSDAEFVIDGARRAEVSLAASKDVGFELSANCKIEFNLSANEVSCPYGYEPLRDSLGEIIYDSEGEVICVPV